MRDDVLVLFAGMLLGLFLVLMPKEAYPQTFTQNVSGEITANTQQYTPLVNRLKAAKSNDVVNIYINSPGGYVSTTLKIVKAIVESKALVVCHVKEEAASGAAFILLSCDKKQVSDNARILFHLGQIKDDVVRMYDYQNDKTLKDKLIHMFHPFIFGKHIKQAMYLTYVMSYFGLEHLLTKWEWQSMMLGEDVVLTGKMFTERWDNR